MEPAIKYSVPLMISDFVTGYFIDWMNNEYTSESNISNKIVAVSRAQIKIHFILQTLIP